MALSVALSSCNATRYIDPFSLSPSASWTRSLSFYLADRSGGLRQHLPDANQGSIREGEEANGRLLRLPPSACVVDPHSSRHAWLFSLSSCFCFVFFCFCSGWRSLWPGRVSPHSAPCGYLRDPDRGACGGAAVCASITSVGIRPQRRGYLVRHLLALLVDAYFGYIVVFFLFSIQLFCLQKSVVFFFCYFRAVYWPFGVSFDLVPVATVIFFSLLHF